MQDQIRLYLQNLKHLPHIENDQKLIDPMDGIMDSLDIAEMVAWLEETYQVQFGPEDLNTDNLKNLNAIVKLVKRRTQLEV